jgi:hypothetical protein
VSWSEALAGAYKPSYSQLQQGVNRSTSIKNRATNKGSNEDESWDEEEDMEMEDIPDSNFQILDSSLHGKFDGEYGS